MPLRLIQYKQQKTLGKMQLEYMTGEKEERMRQIFERKDSSREREDEEYHCEMHYSKTMLHKRKCIQHHSSAIQETENEKGKSEFVHLGKTSHWRQSISKSVLLKRAW